MRPKPNSSIPSGPPVKKRYFTRRRVIFIAAWLVIFLVALLIGQRAFLGRLNRELSRLTADSTGGRIAEVELHLSFLRLYEMLSLMKDGITSIRATGKPIIEKLILSEPTVQLIPLTESSWKARIELRGLDAEFGSSPVFMTRNGVENGKLIIKPDDSEIIRFENLDLFIGPPARDSSQLLRYSLHARNGCAIHLEGHLGKDTTGGWISSGTVESNAFPLRFIRLTLGNIGSIIQSGEVSGSGSFAFSQSLFGYEGSLKLAGLSFNIPQGTDPALAAAIERINRSGEINRPYFRFSLDTRQPAEKRLRELLIELGSP